MLVERVGEVTEGDMGSPVPLHEQVDDGAQYKTELGVSLYSWGKSPWLLLRSIELPHIEAL